MSNSQYFRAASFFAALPLLVFLFSCSQVDSVDFVTSDLEKVYSLENDSLFLTDRVSDFIALPKGYMFAEENRSTLLFTDSEFNPLARTGSKGNGPNEFDQLGSLELSDGQVIVYDRFNSRLVFTDIEGKIQRAFKHNIFGFDILNFCSYRDSLLVFSIPDKSSPLTSLNIRDMSFKNILIL